MKTKSPSQTEFIALSSKLIAEKDPEQSATLASQLWEMTYRSQTPDHETQLLNLAEKEVLYLGDQYIQTYTWGQGTPILLIHGWNGRAGQMAEIATALAQTGFQVTAIDLPGHGESSGDETDLLKISASIAFLHQQCGPFHSIVSHSFGGMCLFHALQKGIFVERIVSISTPARIETLVDKFSSTFNLTQTVISKLKRRLEERHGSDIWQAYSMNQLTQNITVPGLLIHDNADEYIAIDNMFEINAAWPSSNMLPTNNLGHNGILSDSSVIQAITQFLLR